MDADALKAMQAPIKERYRETPDAAVVTLKAEGTVGEGVTCRVATSKALIEAGLHPATGGSGMHACSGDMYAGVPITSPDCVNRVRSDTCEMPKSVILIVPFRSISKLDGLISR